jgi:lysophospholipase L1-like esterase
MLYPNLFYGAQTYLPFFAQKKTDSDEWAKYRRSRPAATDAVAEAQFRAALESFIAVAQVWDIEVVLMTQFNRIRSDDDAIRQNYLRLGRTRSYDEYVPIYARFNEIVRELATQYKLVLIDLDRLVPPDEHYVYDPVHLNNAGSVLVADIISAELAKNFADLSLKN